MAIKLPKRGRTRTGCTCRLCQNPPALEDEDAYASWYEHHLKNVGKGLVTYFIATACFDGASVEEDSELDLIKIGQAKVKNVDKRIADIRRSCPWNTQVRALVYGLPDWVSHSLAQQLDEHPVAGVPLEYNLAAPSEWFRGGCEQSIIQVLWRIKTAGLMSWVRICDADGNELSMPEGLS